MPEADAQTPCLRCGNFVRDDERPLRDLAFCPECLDSTAPEEVVKRIGAPWRVRRHGWLALLIAAGFAIATGALDHYLGQTFEQGCFVGLMTVLPWWIVLLLIDDDPSIDGYWREHVLTIHDFPPLAGEPPHVVLFWHGPKLFELGVVFESEEGFAFFGAGGSRKHVRFSDHGPACYPLRHGFLPPILPWVRLGDEPDAIGLQSLSSGRRGRRWAKAFVARRAQPRMRFETDARSS